MKAADDRIEVSLRLRIRHLRGARRFPLWSLASAMSSGTLITTRREVLVGAPDIPRNRYARHHQPNLPLHEYATFRSTSSPACLAVVKLTERDARTGAAAGATVERPAGRATWSIIAESTDAPQHTLAGFARHS